MLEGGLNKGKTVRLQRIGKKDRKKTTIHFCLRMPCV